MIPAKGASAGFLAEDPPVKGAAVKVAEGLVEGASAEKPLWQRIKDFFGVAEKETTVAKEGAGTFRTAAVIPRSSILRPT